MAFSLLAMWKNKCPRCHIGDLFKKPLKLSAPLDMHERCSHCQQKFEPEPGFYFGAMFLSYIIAAFVLIIPALVMVFVLDMNVDLALILTVVFLLMIYIKLLRGSRSLWIHIIVKHDPKYNA